MSNKNTGWGGNRNGAGPKIKLLKLSHAESMLITDALNGVIVMPETAEQQLWLEVEDAIAHRQLDQKWNVDGAALVEKLKKLSHDAAIEIVDNVNKFWSNSQ